MFPSILVPIILFFGLSVFFVNALTAVAMKSVDKNSRG